MYRIWVVLLGLLLVSPATAKDRLVIGISQYPSTLHPLIDSMVAKSYLHGFTQRPLTTYDAAGKLQCLLCTEVPTEANGRVRSVTRDGKQVRAVDFTLQDKAVWGDGTPITSQDVVFTFNLARIDAVGISNYDFFARSLAAIEVRDDKNFTLIYDKLLCDAAAVNDFYLLPKHLEEARLAKGAADYRRHSAYDQDSLNAGLWNGPYRLAGLQAGSEVRLVRNEKWWGAAPAFAEIILKVVENTAALEAQLRAGQIDMIAGELGLTLDQALSFQRRHGDDYQIIIKPGYTYEHIDLKLDNPIFADARLRQALLLGLDRGAISSQLFAGQQPVADGFVPPQDSVYSQDMPRYDFDPSRASLLLTEAGWNLGRSGLRENSAGESLRFTFRTTAGNKSRELVQQAIQQQWRQLGVVVEIKNEPARVLFGQTMRERQFDGAVMYAWMSAPRGVPRTTLHSSMIPTAANGFGGQNYMGWNNPRVDQILDELQTSCRPDDNQQLWNELQKIYASELPALPLFWRADAHILPKALSGLVPTGHQYPSSQRVEDWRYAP